MESPADRISAQPEWARTSGTAKRGLIRYAFHKGEKADGSDQPRHCCGSHGCNYTAAYIIERLRQYEWINVVERKI